ncbi:DinB family protein, partial [Cesiribacter andamanensis]|uniref:DinB family protein n=1 Tax=Cesiribacter andamanensis TaxID=649507 RepID=UPI00058B9960
MNNPRYHQEWLQLEQEGSYFQQLLLQQTEAVLKRQPAPDKWSALQVIEHLVGVETAATHYLLRKNYTPLMPRGLPGPLRAFILMLALKSPLKFKAPAVEGLRPHNTSRPTELLERWKAVRTKLAGYVEALPADKQESLLFLHPLAGALSLRQTLQFMAAHMQHHRRQASAALRQQ